MNAPLHSDKDAELVRLELSISLFLRWGVAFSALLLAIGWLGQLLNSGDVLANFQVYRPEPLIISLKSALAAHDYPFLCAASGLGVLVSLPIFRVILTAYLFVKQRDLYLAAMALFVFAVLLGSFFLGIEL